MDLIFGYTGKQLDEATGLQHNLFRWYDSALGQWLSEDPIGFAAGDENVRRYVGNGPADAIDPTGLEEPLVLRDPRHTVLLPLPHWPSSRERFNDLYPDKVGFDYSDDFVEIMLKLHDGNVWGAQREEYHRQESIKFNQRMLVAAANVAPAVAIAVYAGPAAVAAAAHVARVGHVLALQHGQSAGTIASEMMAGEASVTLVGGLAVAKIASSGGPQILRNSIQCELGEAVVRQRLLNSRSLDLVGEQIRINTPGIGLHRVIDFLVRGKKTGRLRIIEVKTGDATRDAVQLAKDRLIADLLTPTTFSGCRANDVGIPNGTPTGAILTMEINASNLKR